MIPTANIRHLMLDEEVLTAVAEGRFHVWAVATVDAGIELLSGRPAGVRDSDGRFPVGTVYHAVEDRLRHLADIARQYSTRS
jgi:predicted ATP-dependent protease